MAKPDYEVAYHWTRGDRTGWKTIGHAFVNGDKIKLHLMAVPVPGTETNPGEYTLFKAGTGAKGAKPEGS